MKILLLCLLFTPISCGGTESQYIVEYDYETTHGLRVVLEGPINSPSQELVEKWTEETRVFWQGPFHTFESIPPNIYAYFFEAEWLEDIQGEKYGGFAFFEAWKLRGEDYHRIETSSGSELKVSYVFRHELSHIVLTSLGIPSGALGGDIHHRLFKSYGFDELFIEAEQLKEENQ